MYSYILTARCGLTAGSGFATTEMRLIMIHIVDAAMLVAPRVEPTLFVDDLSVEMIGSAKQVANDVVAFVRHVVDSIARTKMGLSSTKCA